MLEDIILQAYEEIRQVCSAQTTAAATPTTSQSAGVHADDVVSLHVNWQTSGAIDNLVFIPTPASTALLGMGALIAGRRRRN